MYIIFKQHIFEEINRNVILNMCPRFFCYVWHGCSPTLVMNARGNNQECLLRQRKYNQIPMDIYPPPCLEHRSVYWACYVFSTTWIDSY